MIGAATDFMRERKALIEEAAFTEARYSWTEADLAMPRAKPRSLLITAGYWVMKLGRMILGRRQLLQMCLNAGWLFRQFAYELSGEVFGSSFHCS